MDKIICSGGLFYSLDTQRFLFLHRTQSKQPNVWGLVGGTNETEEIPYQALLREIKEEIGDTSDIVKSIPLETFVSNALQNKQNLIKLQTVFQLVSLMEK